MKCFYHIDPDGWCSGYWVRYLCDHLKNIDNSYSYTRDDFIPFNYGFKFPLDKISENEKVFIVDLSIDVADMEKLLTITNDIVWIDHHKTSIEKYANFHTNLPGIRYDGLAACILTYAYVIHTLEHGSPDNDRDAILSIITANQTPYFTKYIADFDVWDFKYGDDTRNFVAYINSRLDTHPCDEIWDSLNSGSFNKPVNLDDIEKILSIGQEIRNSNEVMANNYVSSKGMVGTFEGLKVCIVNISPGFGNSLWFENNPMTKDLDAWIIFGITALNGKLKYSYSIYSKKYDISEIAKKYGGGGHRGASGFSTDEFIFKADELVSLRKYYEENK